MAWKRGQSSLKSLLLPRCPDAGQPVLSPGVIQLGSSNRYSAPAHLPQERPLPRAGACPAVGYPPRC